jgi:hypothetical protein
VSTLFQQATSTDLAYGTNPLALVPGAPDSIASTATSLITIGTGLGEAGDAMGQLSTEDGWSGEAAEAFRAKIAPFPAAWRRGTALADAGHALAAYGETLRHAQSQAAQAIQQHTAAVAATKQAADTYNQAVDRHNQAVDAANAGQGPAPAPMTPFADPGASGRAAAQQVLDDARHSVDTAAQQLLAALAHARDELPPQPDFWQRLVGGISDSQQQMLGFGIGVAEGAAGAAEGLVRMARTFNPNDPWNMTHPLGYLDNMGSVVTGLASAVVTDPVGFGENLIDWKDWTSGHEGRATGQVGFNLVLGLAGGAGVGSAAADAATGGLAGLARTAVTKVTGAVARRGGAGAADDAAATVARAGADTAAAGNAGRATHGLPEWNPAARAPSQPGAFGHPDIAQPAPPAAPAHTPPATTPASSAPDQLQAADQQAAAQVQHAGGGLDSVERQLDGLHVNPGGGAAPVTAAEVARGMDGGSLGALERKLDNLHVNPGGGLPPRPRADIPPGSSMSRELPSTGGVPGGRRPSLDQPGSAAPGNTPGPHPAAPVSSTGKYPIAPAGPPGIGRPNLPAPLRPREVSSQYLEQVLTHQEQLAQLNLGRYVDYPKLRAPDFEPGNPPPGFLHGGVPDGALDAALHKVDVAKIHLLHEHDMGDVWRDEPDWLAPENAIYRMDNRDAASVWDSGGFDVRNMDNLSIGSHVAGARDDGFVSFSYSPEMAVGHAVGVPPGSTRLPDGTFERLQYVHEAYHPSGIDTSVSFRNAGQDPGYRDGELLFPGGFDSAYIRRAFPRLTRYDPEGNLIGWRVLPPIENPDFAFQDLLVGGI